MRKLVLIPLAALVFATSCGDDDSGDTNGSTSDGPTAAERDCTGKSLPPQADATTTTSTASSGSTPADGSTGATAPVSGDDAATDSSAATSTPSGWMRPRGFAPENADTTVPSADTTGASSGSTAPPTTYAPKPKIELPDPLPKELKVTDLEKGTGTKTKDGDTVVVHYVGVRSEDGTEFDSNYDSKDGYPVTIGQSNVIKGWHQGLVGMRVGGVRQLDIPASLAYGKSPPKDTPIKAGDTLTFVVTLDNLFREPDTADVEPSLCAKKLLVEDVREGTGTVAKQGDTLALHLKVMRGDNKVLINDTWVSGEAASVTLDAAGLPLPGLVEGITGMKVGGERVITMPPDQAFGWQGAPSQGIPADTDVIAIVDLVGVTPA